MEKRKKIENEGCYGHFTFSMYFKQPKSYQTVSKMTPTSSEKPLHQRSRSQSPASSGSRNNWRGWFLLPPLPFLLLPLLPPPFF